jgi:Nucleotidyl transferase AbiEii toxin, Type IV TA system
MSPKPVERLEKTLARVADEQGIDRERLRRWVSFLALCGVLERAVSAGILNSYYLKGGVAMELRFAAAARATKDLDLALDGNRAARMLAFEKALKLGFDDFTFRLKPRAHQMDVVDTVRVEVAVEHRTRGWQTIDVDLGPAGAAEVDLVVPAVKGLAEMNLPVPTTIRCLGVNEQVAQKLHACTAPGARGRARDVLDILLFDLLGKIEYARARGAAEHIFKERGTHTFPPALVIPAEWRVELVNLATEFDFPIKTADEIEEKFRALVARISEG